MKEGVIYINKGEEIIHICSCGKEWLVKPGNILTGNSKSCGSCYSFAQWGIDNIGEDFLEEYWDYTKNVVDPWKISVCSIKIIYIYCNKVNYHGSYKTNPAHFTKGGRCGFCKGDKQVHPNDSFAQYLINLYGDNALELYWDYDKNTIDPWKITFQSNKKVWVKCQLKDYHDSYDIRCPDFINGDRCGYCGGKKVHLLDSIGTLYPQVLNVWSNKNKESPFKYPPGSNKKVWFKCESGKHEDYSRIVYSSIRSNFRCPECVRENTESQMATTLKQVLKYEYPDTIWEYDAGFRTNKNVVSRYDIYVPKLNLLIECQSEYHDDNICIVRDELKKQFAINNKYKYIAIDKREYSSLEAIQIFFPYIKEVPDYVDYNKNTMRNWDLKEAQLLLDKGYNFEEVAIFLETTYGAIHGAINSKQLIKPNNYHQIGSKKIVCLTKDFKFIKQYNSVSDAAKEVANGNNSSISSCLTMKIKVDTGNIREILWL